MNKDHLKADISRLREVLNLVLDQVDYTGGNCSPTDMVAAALPREVIQRARSTLDATKHNS